MFKVKVTVAIIAGILMSASLTSASENQAQPIFCWAVSGNEYDMQEFGIVAFTDYDPEVRMQKISPGKSAPETGYIQADTETTRFDFSDGGDQYWFVDFQTDQLAAILEGSAWQIYGEFEDGFDWINGYEVRSHLILECALTINDVGVL